MFWRFGDLGIWRFGDWENCVTLSGVEVHFMRLGDWEIGRLRCFEHFVTLSGVEVLQTCHTERSRSALQGKSDRETSTNLSH